MQKGEGTRMRLWAVCGLRSDQEGHGWGPGLASRTRDLCCTQGLVLRRTACLAECSAVIAFTFFIFNEWPCILILHQALQVI